MPPEKSWTRKRGDEGMSDREQQRRLAIERRATCIESALQIIRREGVSCSRCKHPTTDLTIKLSSKGFAVFCECGASLCSKLWGKA